MATTKALLDAFIKAGVNHYGNLPTGTMAPFAGTTVPDGWLLCNGANVSRTTYANLFAVIGTKWGTGDGSTTFTLPNCNNRVLEGTTNTSSVGTYLEAGLPNITGSVFDCFGGAYRQASGCFYTTGTAGYGGGSSGKDPQAVALQASRSSSTYGGSSTVQPASVYTLIIIKV